MAFLPQFLNPEANFLTQMALFETTFLILAFFNAFGYAMIASRARAAIRNNRIVGAANKIGGTLLIGAGIAAATAPVRQD